MVIQIKVKINKESVTVSACGTIEYICLKQVLYVSIVRLISVILSSEDIIAKYLLFFLENPVMNSTGISQQITVLDFKKIVVTVPEKDVLLLFTKRIEPLFLKVNQNKAEILRLIVL